MKEKPSEMTVMDKPEVFLEWESLEDIVRRVIAQREISGTFLHTFLEMAETDSDLRNLGPRPRAQTAGYKPVYTLRSKLRRSVKSQLII